MSDIGYSEKDFENYIVNILTSKNGYIHGNNDDYNTQKSILPEIFISFIKSTQPDNWTCLCDKFDTEKEAEEKLIDELIAARKSQGTLDLFRKGCTFRSIQFDTVYWKPENNLNPETIELYNKNIFTVINQLIGDAGKSVHTPIPDIVLFINGPQKILCKRNESCNQSIFVPGIAKTFTGSNSFKRRTKVNSRLSR